MTSPSPAAAVHQPRFPALIALLFGAVGFISLLTEVLPAGVLPALAADLGVSQSLAGQSTGVFALGCIVAAIPLTMATARLPRRTVLLAILLVSAIANFGTAFAASLPGHLGFRFLAGCAAGAVWAALPGYTRGFSTPANFGANLSIALGGGTLSLALGVPVGTLLSIPLGWRGVFALIAGITVAIAVHVRCFAPRVPGPGRTRGAGLGAAIRTPLVLLVLGLVIGSVVGQNVAYTFIAPVLAERGGGLSLSAALTVFGVASLIGTLGAGRLPAAQLGRWVFSALALAALGLGLLAWPGAPLLAALIPWGLAFGAYSVLTQLAVGRAGGPAADAAQSLLVTSWNLAIMAGGALGGIGLAIMGPIWLAPLATAITVLTIPVGIAAARGLRLTEANSETRPKPLRDAPGGS